MKRHQPTNKGERNLDIPLLARSLTEGMVEISLVSGIAAFSTGNRILLGIPGSEFQGQKSSDTCCYV